VRDLQPQAAQAQVQELARAAAQGLLAPSATANDRDERFPEDSMRHLARSGLFGINVPKAYGGLEAGVVAYALAVRELASACAGTTVGLMVTNMVAEAITRFGDESQRQRWLPGLLRGAHAAASFCLSEPGSGSDAASLRATARREGDDYVLDGTKAWITSGGRAGLYLVMARTSPDGGSRGISAFIVEAGTPGLSATKPEDKLGMRASVTTQIVLDGCRVPAANRLGDEGDGFKVAMGSLDGGRIGVAAQACGIAAAAQRCAIEFAQGARADGSALSEQQSAQWLVADNAVELDAGWLLVLRAAALKDKGAPHSREAAMAKVFCTEMASEVASRALQVLGEAGEDSRYSAERNLRDARVTRIYEGTSEVQRIVIARECLKALS
jgi:hypothetical protein